MVDDKRARGDWPLAIITRVYSDSQVLVRHVQLRTSLREYERDRNKIVLLEADEPSDGGGYNPTDTESTKTAKI